MSGTESIQARPAARQAVNLAQAAIAPVASLVKAATSLVIAALVVTLVTLQSASANTGTEEIIALSLYEQDKTLYKATPQTLASSSDGGKTWRTIPVPPMNEGSVITDFAVSTQDNNLLYLATTGAGVLRSTDGGHSWDEQANGLPGHSVSMLTTHSSQAQTVYAYIPEQGIYRSQDGGASWRMTDRGPKQTLRDFVHSDMPGSMETGWLFAASSDGVRRSMDCFCGWHRAGEVSGQMTAIAYDPDEPSRVYAAGEPGLFVSEDGGETWTALKSPTMPVTALLAAPGKVLYLSSGAVLYRSGDHGKTWQKT